MTPSLTDPLTTLPRRRRLEQRLNTLFAAPTARTIGLLVVDLDRFQALNDTLGRDVGDDALRLIGARLRVAIGSDHLVVRLWSDEFGILIERSATAERLAALAARVQRVFEQPLPLGTRLVPLRVSIGGALVFTAEGSWPELLHEADLAARRARRRGSGYELYRAIEEDAGRELLLRVHELRAALADDRLLLRWQPRPPGDGAIRQVAAEVRWLDPELGLLEPEELLLVAEAAEIADRLACAVLAQALGQLAGWLGRGHDIGIVVPYAASRLHDVRSPTAVGRLLAEAGVAPSRLTLAVDDLPHGGLPRDGRAAEVTQELRALGVAVERTSGEEGGRSLAPAELEALLGDGERS